MKTMLDETQLEEMLANLAPTQTGRLEKRMAAAPWTPRGMARRRLMNTTALAALLALGLFLAATPQGSAFAQSILRYFVRVESDTRPIPTLIAVAADAVTPSAPSMGELKLTEMANSFPATRLPFEDTCGDLLSARCGLDEIRAMVTFPVMGLKTDGDGLIFAGATGGPQQVMLIYTGESINGSLTITQEPVGERPAPQVAASAVVEPVTINGATGEYAQGGWYSTRSEGVSWLTDPFVQTVRWEDGAVLYTLVFHAGKDTGRVLDKDELLALAGQLSPETDARASRERPQPVEVELISAQAGFTVIQPGWLPAQYVFQGGAYTSEYHTACLYFTYGAGDTPTLAIAVRPSVGLALDDITTTMTDYQGTPIPIPVMTEPVTVGGAQGGQPLWITNGVNASKLCPYPDFITNQALYWQRDGKDYYIFGLIDQFEGGAFITQLEMLRLAENLTGVVTLPDDPIDPGRLNVEQAARLASFALKTPTQMVAGLQFDHAVHMVGEAVAADRAASEPGKSAEAVSLIYTPEGKSTRGGMDYNFAVSQVNGALRSLEEIYQWGEFERVTINGQPGLYRQMCWDSTTGGTDCRQELYWDENGTGYGFNLYLPGALPREELFAIAESMAD